MVYVEIVAKDPEFILPIKQNDYEACCKCI